MTIAVPSYPHLPDSTDLKTGRPMSTILVGDSLVKSCNFLNGHCLGGVKSICMYDPTATAYDGVGYLYTYRHANCDYQDLSLRIGKDATVEGDEKVTVTAGTGTAITVNLPDATDGQWVHIRVPWGASDTGIQPISIDFTDLNIDATILWDHQREYLEAGDYRLTYRDATYRAIGMERDHAIAVSASSGPSGVMTEVKGAWTRHRRQIYGIWIAEAHAITFTGGTATDLLGHTIRAMGRQKRSTETQRNVVIVFRAKVTTGSYEIKATSDIDNDAIELSNTSYAVSSTLAIPISCTDLDSITIEGRITSGAGTGSLVSLSIIESES